MPRHGAPARVAVGCSGRRPEGSSCAHPSGRARRARDPAVRGSGSASTGSGISATTRVPPLSGLSTSSRPSRAARRSDSPRRPEPLCRIGGADAVVGDLDHDAAVDGGDADVHRSRLRVLDDVRDRLGDDVVRGRLDRRGQPLRGQVELDRQRRPRGQAFERRAQAAVGEHGGMDAARELAQLLERLRQLLARAHEQLVGRIRIARQLRLRQPQRQRERDQPLLRAVVEVALEPPPRVVARRDDARPRRAQLLFLLLAQRDVETAGDDADDLAVVVEERRAAPGDDAPLAALVREGVLVLGGREVGRGGVEARDHRGALGLVDEDVPEGAAAHVVVAREAARLDGRRVDVADHAVGVDRDEQAAGRLDDGVEVLVLRAQLGLEPLVVEGERDRGGDALDQLGLVAERLVVHERADRPAVALHDRGDAAGARLGQLEGAAVAVDEALLLVEPEGELERGIAERLRDRVAQRHALSDRDDERGDRAARQPAAEDPEEERERHRGEEDEEERADRVRGVGRDLRQHVAHEQDEERPAAGEVHGQQRPAQRRRRPAPAPHEHRDDGDDEADREGGADRVDDDLGRVRLHDHDGARAALAAAAVRVLREEEQQRRPDQHERGRQPHEQLVGPRREPSGRVREHERCEGDEREVPEPGAQREEPVVVALGQRGEEPQVADAGQVDAGAVLGPAVERDQPGGDERDACRAGERRRRPLVRLVVAREDQSQRHPDLRQRDRDGQRECEGAGAQGPP